MKILQVIHDFLPKHQAGSELYCYHLSKALQTLGHDVRLFYSEIDHQRSSYTLRRDEFDGLPFWEIVNNHSFSAFEETYWNPSVETVFEQCLQEFQPDIVHFHHLLGLSYGCVHLCQQHGAPVVFTLHDYWLTCPRGGGQRYRGESQVCHEVDTRLCAQCISRYSYSLPKAVRWTKRFLSRLESGGNGDLLPRMIRGRISTPRRGFVSRGQCAIDGITREVLYAHPPSRITFQADIPENAQLLVSIAMLPSTYGQPGGGVSFRIRCDGELLVERSLMVKQNPADRGWHTLRIPLEKQRGNHQLDFETEASPSGNIDFCSACWGEPRLVVKQESVYRASSQTRFQRLAETALHFVQQRPLRKKAETRARLTQELFDQVDLFIAPSHFLRSKFIEYGLDAAKIIDSDYGIFREGYAALPRKPEPPIRFTYIGTMVEHKGLHVLIAAFNRLPDPAAVLDVYGDLSEFSDYVKRIHSMITHPGIHLRGRAENQEIPRILAQTDLLVVPSIWFENSPITIHEAFLARVPVIASRFGGMADLVSDGKNGLLFTLGDADSLYECLRKCAKNPDSIESIRPDPAAVKTILTDAEWMAEIYLRLLADKK